MVNDRKFSEQEKRALIARIHFLVSLNERDKGGPYGGVAADSCMNAMKEAAEIIESTFTPCP